MIDNLKVFGKDLKYVFHVILHPFDGFWDLKHEKRGSKSVATFILAMFVIVTVFYKQFAGYTFNTYAVFPQHINAFTDLLQVVLITGMWVISNWALTTLFDGEGSMKDIYIYTGYSLMPAVLAMLILIPITNILTIDEASIVSLINFVGVFWSAILIYTGTMTTHQYSAFKTLFIMLAIGLGMAIFAFLALMFFFLLQQLFNFVYVIYRELELRR